MLTPPDPAEGADYGSPLDVLWQQAVASGYGGSPSTAYGAYLARGERDGERPVGRTRRGSIPCKYYNQQGGCASGRHCKFMHGTPAGGGAFGDGLGGDAGPKNRGVLCRFYARGYCRSGRKCPYSHSAGGADVDFNYHRRKSEFRAGGGADFGADMAALYGDLSGVELEEMRAALERQRLRDGGYLDGEEGGESGDRQRLGSAGEEEWMIEGVTPDMDSSDPSERQGTPLRLRQHPPSLLSRGSSNSLSDMPTHAYAPRPRRNGPPRRTNLAELIADAVTEGRLTRHGSTGTLAQLAQQQHHLQHHHQPQPFSSPSSPLYASSTRLSHAATMGMRTPSSLKHSSSATDLDENTIKSMAIFAMEGSSTPSSEVKTPRMHASNSSSRLQHYLSSAAASPRSTTTGPFSPPSLGTSPSAIGTLLDRCGANGPPQDILGSSFNSTNGLLLPPPLHSSGSNGSLLLNSPHASPLLRAALGGATLSTLASGAYHRGSFSSLASFKLEEDEEGEKAQQQDGSTPADEGREDGSGLTKEEGSGEEGGGSDEGREGKDGEGRRKGEDEDDDLEFRGFMDGAHFMEGHDEEEEEEQGLQQDMHNSDEAFLRSGKLHLPFDHHDATSAAYRASLAGAYTGGAQQNSTWGSPQQHPSNLGPQYHTQPPAFDDQGYFYGAAGTFGNGNGGELGGGNNGPMGRYTGSPNQRFRPRREYQDQPRWAEVVGGGRQFPDNGYQPRNRHESRATKMCRFYLQGNCIHGSRCRNSHDVALPNLDEGADPPRTVEECRMLDEEETRRSVGVECIICSEEIRGRFGIMTNCDHTFCLSCIRTWRQQNTESQDTSNVRCCPVCKQTSHFVVPHFRHVTDPVRKDNLVRNYKLSMAKKPCKYFEYGREECPFGSSCFYAHLNPDGSRAEPPVIRTRMGEEGVVSVVQEVRLSDFLEAHRR